MRKELRYSAILVGMVMLWTVALCGMTDAVGAAEDSPDAAAAREVATAPLHGFFRPDTLPPREWDGYYGEGWRNWDPVVPSSAGPGGFIQLYLHNEGGINQIRSILLSAGTTLVSGCQMHSSAMARTAAPASDCWKAAHKLIGL